jgi:hypothetical protein
MKNKRTVRGYTIRLAYVKNAAHRYVPGYTVSHGDKYCGAFETLSEVHTYITAQKKCYQVGGKGGRKFHAFADAEAYEQKLRSKDGIFRAVEKI